VVAKGFFKTEIFAEIPKMALSFQDSISYLKMRWNYPFQG
jgi:hypothetical protein